MMKKKVLVGMSGGMDSTIAAYLLKKQGHDVTGVTMGIYGKGSISGKSLKSACYGPSEDKDIKDAQQAAKNIGIAHHVVDLQIEYKTVVLDYFCSGYLSGRTPNPCIICIKNKVWSFDGISARDRAGIR